VFLIKRVFEGAIDNLQVMDEQGNVDQANFPKGLTDQKIVEMYKYMLFARALDAKMLSLQRQGRAATYAPLIGEEATQIGSAFALRNQDVFVPNFRQHGVFLVRNFPLDNFFIYWKGYEDGGKMPENFNGTAVCVPVATQLPHATGIAFALKHMNKDAAVVTYVGDGGTSEGDFYEALNFAGVWKAPVVVIIENNQWAISVPRSKQTAAQTLAQKAIAAGIKGVQVDGNDLVAVYKATSDAIADAKNGPTLIECVTYRMSMHTTADDPTKYRSEEEVDEWKRKDPIARVKAYLTKKGFWNDDMEKQTADEQLKKIDEAVEKAEQFKPDPKSMFENVYSFIPETLKEEMDAGVAADFWQ
jgi:pyruvate dehydrogenase E1 component alpha subunit